MEHLLIVYTPSKLMEMSTKNNLCGMKVKKHQYGKQMIITLISLILIMTLRNAQGVSRNYSFNSIEDANSTLYIDHDPIHIQGNAAFLSTAATEGWIGNGSASNPIIIEGLNLIPDGHRAFDLIDTDLHFVFRNNQIVGPYSLIGVFPIPEFINVENGNITFNTILNPGHGFELLNCKNMVIQNNFVNRTQMYAMAIAEGDHLIIRENTFTNCILNTINVKDSANITIENNLLANGKEAGVILFNTDDTLINSNQIENNSGDGIDITFGSDYNNISANLIRWNGGSGIYIDTGSSNNIVLANEFKKNSGTAIKNEGTDNIIESNVISNSGLGIEGSILIGALLGLVILMRRRK